MRDVVSVKFLMAFGKRINYDTLWAAHEIVVVALQKQASKAGDNLTHQESFVIYAIGQQ